MDYLVVRVLEGKRFCEELYHSQHDLLNAIEGEDSGVESDVELVISLEGETANVVSKDYLAELIAEGNETAKEVRETEEYLSRSSNFI